MSSGISCKDLLSCFELRVCMQFIISFIVCPCNPALISILIQSDCFTHVPLLFLSSASDFFASSRCVILCFYLFYCVFQMTCSPFIAIRFSGGNRLVCACSIPLKLSACLKPRQNGANPMGVWESGSSNSGSLRWWEITPNQAKGHVEIAKLFLSVVILLSLCVCLLHALPSELTSSPIV